VPIYNESFANEDIKTYLIDAYGKSLDFDFCLLEKAQYSLLKCCDCALIFQENIPNSEMISEIYEKWIDPDAAMHRQETYGISYFSRYGQDIQQLLGYLKKPLYKVKVLDFGMGWGRWALMAKAFGCEAYGTELSQQRIEYAQSHGIKMVEWDDIPACSFDVINTDQVFEHLSNPAEVLAHLRRSLAPNGVIKIAVPNSFGIRYRLHKMDWLAPKGSFKSLNPVAPLEHINCFSRKSMLELARRTGLQEVKIPLGMQYRYTSIWNSPKQVLRNLILPIYRNVLGLQNYYLFKDLSS